MRMYNVNKQSEIYEKGKKLLLNLNMNFGSCDEA